MTQTRVGIVIRTKDRPLFIPRAIRSVLNQSCDDWTAIVVNDGGDPKLLGQAISQNSLTKVFEDGRISVLTMEQSVGRSDAFNRAAEALNTEFVCCLDDDDTWEPTFLTDLLEFYDQTHKQATDLGGVASLVVAKREDVVLDRGREKIVELGPDPLPHAFERTDFFINPIAYTTYRHDLYPVQWMLNREAVLAAGGFPSDFSVMEDRAFMTRFLQTWRLAVLDKPLAYHHRRVQRTGDTSQNVMMNTLDNPSYNWRFYSDLAKLEVNTPPGDAANHALSVSQAGDIIRAASATIVKELNDETSALWHKLNGEATSIRARIDSLEARLGAVAPMQEIETPEAKRVWSLWDAVGEYDLGYVLSSKKPFIDRFSLSMHDDQPGLFLHASPSQQRLVLQIPRTGDFSAMELSLDGLTDLRGGVRCEVVLSSAVDFLFQTGLSVASRDRLGRVTHNFTQGHVHSCPPGGSVKVTRDFAVEQLGQSGDAKFSIALPRQALDFRLTCRDLVVSRI